MKITLKTTLVAGAAALGLAAAVALAKADYPRLKKDVAVMESILKTEFERGDEPLRGLEIRGHYLAEQGVVFTVDVSRRHSVFSFHTEEDDEVSRFVLRGAPPAPDAISFDEFEFETIIDNAMEEAGRAMRMVEIDRESRELMREVAMDMRDVERELARINLQMIHADDDEKASLEEEAASLDQQLAELETRQEQVEQEIERRVEVRHAEREQERAKREQARQEQLARLEKRLVQSLCDYGTTLRSLPDNEHVSLIIDAEDNQRQIVVMDRRDIMNCSPGSDALQSKALKYLF